MGQWSHRRRRGGRGSTAPAALISITLAERLGSDQILLTYTGPISAAAFNPTDFDTDPNDFTPDVIDQTDTNIINLNFTPDISLETELAYTGTVPGILTPQIAPVI